MWATRACSRVWEAGERGVWGGETEVVLVAVFGTGPGVFGSGGAAILVGGVARFACGAGAALGCWAWG